MIPYIVKANIGVRYYMSDRTDSLEDVRIVMAENIDEAREKYENYWRSQTSEYSVYYSIVNMILEETLL